MNKKKFFAVLMSVVLLSGCGTAKDQNGSADDVSYITQQADNATPTDPTEVFNAMKTCTLDIIESSKFLSDVGGDEVKFWTNYWVMYDKNPSADEALDCVSKYLSEQGIDCNKPTNDMESITAQMKKINNMVITDSDLLEMKDAMLKLCEKYIDFFTVVMLPEPKDYADYKEYMDDEVAKLQALTDSMGPISEMISSYGSPVSTS